MQDVIQALIGKLDGDMTLEQRHYLRFLYDHLHLEELNNREQQYFINYFFESESLQNMAAFALELAESIQEMQENIPAIEQAERLANSHEQRLYYERKCSEQRRQQLKQQTTKQDNVLYVPFQHTKKECGPMIICLEQTAGMAAYSELCKSMILPLFMHAHQEGRDLYIVPYNHQIHVHYRFENGHVNIADFQSFINYKASGEAAMLPVLQFVHALLQENQQDAEADVIVFTEGTPIDGQQLMSEQATAMLEDMTQKYHAEFSVVAMQEEHFNPQQFWFAHKAFFADHAIQ
ncbi:hypothetical protein I6G82_05035 [Lysinibacillus macroides]|uniref:Uncharacterized protein n=1 Tax=Lysinibacillus macroides TaxID=33935 RepID=A0A0N0UWB3_9BACI|nr:hypothetical protein [Lysinibacillus macroides]KOY80865.1 hypothetical protein ADM90_16955 [Lysinibacillus macroides]QPR68988.1 hypothetical protein I6G82_05035 [Lysinibacillus macroides]